MAGSAATAGALVFKPQGWPVLAQQTTPATPSQELAALEKRAAIAGLPAPSQARAAIVPSDPNSYEVLLPRLLNLMERASESRAGGTDIADDAAELLSRINREEHGAPAEDEDRRGAPSIDSLRAKYNNLFKQCEVKDKYKPNVAELTDFLQKNKDRYQAVSTLLQSSIPWYFIGIIHSLEASFNFKAHLHNGDTPLTRKTVHVPAGRPLDPWNPPSSWEASAADALSMRGLQKETAWGLTSLLYRFEAYNGFGYFFHNMPSPYLWSFSNNYDRGKYVADGHLDMNYESKQCGSATMLKALIEAGAIPQPADDVQG